MKDPLNVWNGEKFEFTLEKICKIVFENDEYVIPNAFKPIMHEQVNRVTADVMPSKKGVRIVFDLSWNKSLEDSEKRLVEYINNGVIVISNRNIVDEYNNKLNTIYVENPWDAWVKLGKYVKAVFPMPTIAITGSTGKTTCTMFAKTVFDEKYNSFISGENGKNFNTPLQIVNQWILRCNDTYNLHIQECGGETPDLIKNAAEIIDADVFAINNIETTQHIATYETVKNLVADKTSFDRVAKKSTIGVINIDDPILSEHKFNNEVVTYGIKNKNANYRAENIRQEGQYLSFDIVYENNITPIRINIIGEYNVYNALMVFAMAKLYNFSDEEIQRGFLKYKSVGIRQNLSEIAGRYLYMDCYNASVESMVLAVEALSKLELEKDAKRIAVIGERKTYDENTYNINYELGKKLAKFENIDKFVVIGEDTNYIIGDKFQSEEHYNKVVFDGLFNNINDKSKCEFCTDLKEFANRIRFTTQKGDAILFKGRAALALWCIPDLAFGTSYTKSDVLMPLGIEKRFVKDTNVEGVWYKYVGGVSLTEARNGFDSTRLILPDSIKGYLITHINKSCFENKTQLKLIILGKYITSIEKAAFKNCINIETLSLPNKTVYIGEEAFSGCISLSNVYAMNVEHLSKDAFKNCKNLKEIYLSETCMTIDAKAFSGCNKNLVICAPRNSVAHMFAQEHNYKYKSIDSKEESILHTVKGTRKYSPIYNISCIKSKEYNDNSNKITVSFVGDIMAHDIHLEGLYDAKKETYDFSSMFEQVKPYLEASDISVGNLETTFGRKKYSSFPKFVSPEVLANNLKYMGIDIVACANNHAFDSNYGGIIRTKEILENVGIGVTGTKSNGEEKGYTVIEKKGFKIAILNYTYRTKDDDGFKTINTYKMDDESSDLINTFSYDTLDDDLLKINKQVMAAREEADVVIVYYHWGVEYDTESNITQKYMAYRTANMGVDAIIGSHPHVIQEKDVINVIIDGVEKKVPVFYSLGNFCWGGRFSRSGRESVHNGIIAQLSFEVEDNNVVNVVTSHVPLYISNEFTDDKFDFSIISLNDLNEFQKNAFNKNHVKTVDDIVTDISNTLNNFSNYECQFEKGYIVKVGKKVNIAKDFFNINDCKVVLSENPSSVIALDDGYIYARKKGFAGIKLVKDDGSTIFLVIQVVGINEIETPILVNEYNRILDIDKPTKIKTGVKLGLKGVTLEEQCAMAWNLFRIYAQMNNKFFVAKKGFATYEGELKEYIAEKVESDSFDELYGKTIPLGYNQYTSGCILDITINDELTANEYEEIENWCLFNAYRFNFVFRIKNNDEKIYSLEYVYDKDLAYIIQNQCKSMKDFYDNIDICMNKYQIRKSSGFVYLNEKERHLDNCNVLTLGRICEVIGIDLPFSYRQYKNLIIPQITMSDINMKKNAVFFYDENLFFENMRTRNAIRKGALTVITDKIIKDENGKKMNQILVEDSIRACSDVCRFIIENNGCKVIGVKEKSSEHVLRDMLNNLLEIKYKTKINEGTSNGRIHMVNTIQTITTEDDYYIQNIEGAYPNFIKENLELLNPSISIILGLEKELPQNYSNDQEYISDIESIINYAIDNNRIVFVNIDEKHLSLYKNHENVISFSMKDKEADFYMEHKNSKDFVAVNIYSKYSGNIINLKLNNEYRDNLIQVLAAYSVAMYIGLSENEIMNSPIGNMKVINKISELEKGINWEFISTENTITVKWDKCEDLTGYHIRCYSEDDKFIKGMHVYDGNEYTFKNMKPGKKYKIRIRGYIILNGIKTYGAYMTKDISTEVSNKININFNKKSIKRFLKKVKKVFFN